MSQDKRKLLTVVLAIVGSLVSALALYEHVIFRAGLATGPSFCNLSQHINCEAVNASDWSLIFGLPIASYGLFFYIAILGLLAVAGPNRGLSDERANRVVFLGAALGSLASIALFAISEFIIGALCLMCMALYLVTFALLAVSWSGSGTSFFDNLARGIHELSSFVTSLFKGRKEAIAGAISLVIWGVLSVLSPIIAREIALINRGDGENVPLAVTDPVKAWIEQAVVQIPIAANQGVFGDYLKGDASAPVQVAEFADFECPGCRMFYSALTPILERFKGQYGFVFKNYPLDAECNAGITSKFHENSCFAANFIRCAGEQGKFWEAVDYAFTDPVLELDPKREEIKPVVNDGRDQLLSGASSAIGLDLEGLRECVSSHRHLDKIKSEIKEADALGLRSTPSIWINGRRVERPTPDAIEKIFEEILRESGVAIPERD
jgi:uncharacterized membrane protein/protein-disulfide isomerase